MALKLTDLSELGAATFSGAITASDGNIILGGTGRIQGIDTVSAGTDATSKTYVDTAITNLIGGAPGALDTLNELAAAIGDDASYAAGITTALGLKAPLASPTFTGTVNASAAAFSGSVDVNGTNYLYLGGWVRLNNPGSGVLKLGQYNGSTWTDTLSITNAGVASFAGDVVISSAGTGGSPSLRINNLNHTTFNHGIEVYNANLVQGESEIILVGKTGATKNAGYLGYYWHAANSDDNFVTIGHYANNHLLRVYGSGSVVATTNMQAPIFYDSNSTNYYLHADSKSNLHSISFDGALSGTTAGTAEIGRNSAYDTLELKGYGAELMIGAQNAGIHINYRPCNSGTSSHTPTTWYWRAGSATSWSTHNFGAVTSNGILSATTDVRAPIFYDSGDTAYYVNPAGTSNLNDVEIVQAAIDSYIYHKGDTNTYFGFPAADQFAMVIGGTTRLSSVNNGASFNFASHISMNNKDIDYVNQLHFNDNVRFYDNGNDQDLNLKFGDASVGHLRFLDGSGNYEGGVYTESGYFGTLASDGSWAVQSSPTLTNIHHYLNVNDSIRTPIFYDKDNTTYFLDPAATDRSMVTSGSISIGTTGQLGLGDITHPKIVYPGKEASWDGSGNTTGQVVIDLPGTLAHYDMMYMEIDIYEYGSDAASKIIIGAHNWNSGGTSNTSTTQWYNIGVKIIGTISKPVYLGRRNDGTSERRCIAIGDVSSTWSYGTVHVAKVHGACYYSDSIDWMSDWNVAQTTSSSYFTANPATNYNTGATTTLATPGRVWANYVTGAVDTRSPIYYDSNDTNYYVNPASNSVLKGTVTVHTDTDSALSIVDGGTNAIGIYAHASDELYLGSNNASKLRIHGGGAIESYADFRAPIFYDSNDTNYYINPASTSTGLKTAGEAEVKSLRLGNGFTLNQGSSNYAQLGSWIDVNLVGLYSSNGSGNSAHLYPNTTSDYGAWRMDGNKGGYNGITFSGTGSTFNTLMAQANGGSMGLYNDTDNEWYLEAVRNAGCDMYYDGVKQLETEDGYALATNQMRSPIFYDSANTAYYLNPADTSTSLSTAGKWFMQGSHSSARWQLNYAHGSDATNSGTLTAWVSEPGITYEGAGIGANIHVSGQYYGRAYDDGYGCYVRFDKGNGAIEGWTTTGTSGTSGGQGTKRWHSDNGGNFYGVTSVRAPLFYDSDNTSYYVNPAGTSVINDIEIDDYIYHKGDTDTYIYFTDNEQTFRTGGTNRVTINNAGTYLNSTNTFFANGTVTNPSISFDSDPDTGMWRNGTNVLAFSTAGENRLNIDASGNAVFSAQLTGTNYVRSLGSHQVVIDSANAAAIQFGSTGDWDAYGYISTSGGAMTIENVVSGANMQLKTPNAMSFFAGGTSNSYKVLQLNASGAASFSGSLSKGSGSFKIDHPLEAKRETHHLVHSFIEGPQADLIYRGKVALVDGTAIVNIDTAAGMTEGTFIILTTDVQCFTTNESNWDLVKGSVSGNKLTIESQNASSTATISWMVVGERQDPHMIATDWTDSDGKVIVEPEK